MNLPNKLTMIRIFLSIPIIVLFCIFWWYVKAIDNKNFIDVDFSTNSFIFLYSIGALFIIAMLTDLLDGYLARRDNKITTFGKLFDPLADKIITTSIYIFLSIFNYTYAIIVVILIIRDLIVDGSRNVAASNKIKVEASKLGKWKTILQTISIIVILFLIPVIDKHKWWQLFIINIPQIFALIFSILSGYFYFKQIVGVLRSSK